MDNAKLERYLWSMGKGCFIKHFALFTDQSISWDERVERLWQAEGYTWDSCRNRVSKAQSIIKAGRVADALRMVAESRLVKAQYRTRARELLALT